MPVRAHGMSLDMRDQSIRIQEQASSRRTPVQNESDIKDGPQDGPKLWKGWPSLGERFAARIIAKIAGMKVYLICYDRSAFGMGNATNQQH